MNDTICMPEAMGEPATRCSAEGERRKCRFTGEFIKGNIPRGNSKFFFISRLSSTTWRDSGIIICGKLRRNVTLESRGKGFQGMLCFKRS